ncbi:histidine-containing phosphotransmitter 1 [Prunus dulcis]|uniref:Histidine-containing phosphotransfer protein n=1 Tax=Prunus dulcis TaxID=3755 RepID=A0A4Y1RL83_PRUDU|nr:histidine-containing phosphotransmitter 1 [Prunus dulcis]
MANEQDVDSQRLAGIVNNQFSQIQTLKSDADPDCAVRLINIYLLDVERMLSELTSLSDLPDVDFSKLATLARSIEEKSSLVGAEHVRSACADLIQACERMHKQNFLRALGWIKNEFAHTRNKLDSFVQMERRIFRVEGREVK